VEEIEQVRDRLTSPERLLPRFRRNVICLEVHDTAAKLLRLVHEHHGSKFPVYEGERFRGLLTEHGITRWLAWHTAADGAKIDLTGVTALDMLNAEETDRNVEFMAADATSDELIRSFSLNPSLQAVLISETGNKTERLQGLATWGDALRLLGE
jgi:CBS domain-containing protein